MRSKQKCTGDVDTANDHIIQTMRTEKAAGTEYTSIRVVSRVMWASIWLFIRSRAYDNVSTWVDVSMYIYIYARETDLGTNTGAK